MATKGFKTDMPLPHHMSMADSNNAYVPQAITKPRSQVNKRKQVSQVGYPNLQVTRQVYNS